MSQALLFEPEHCQLALDEGFGVVGTLEGDSSEVVVGEGDGEHGRTPA